jgi:hypothetical protein
MNTRRNIPALVIVLVLGCGAGALWRRNSAQAQATGAHRWEYCAVTGITRKFGSHQIELIAVITYFGTTGGRTEKVYSGGVDGHPSSEGIQAPTLKAMAELGADGWEVVGSETFNLGFDSGQEHVSGLLFKRPL